MLALTRIQTGYPLSRLAAFQRNPSIGMTAAASITGQTEPYQVEATTAGIGSLVVAGIAVWAAWKFWFRPRLAPSYAAREALSKREKLRLSTLETENEHLTKYIEQVYCAVRDVAGRVGCPIK